LRRPHALPDLVLATRSPRRRSLLLAAGLSHRVAVQDLDDAEVVLPPRVGAPRATMALAWFKARRAAWRLALAGGELLLAADTLCDLDGRLLGQPRTAEEAAEMLRSMHGRAHRTVTGLCLLDPARGRRMIWHESAEVRLGAMAEGDLAEYVASGGWRGKAGAYSLDERRAAGWPLECHGDPEVVLGLPTASLRRRLEWWVGEDRDGAGG
jgi:septum formation protein